MSFESVQPQLEQADAAAGARPSAARASGATNVGRYVKRMDAPEILETESRRDPGGQDGSDQECSGGARLGGGCARNRGAKEATTCSGRCAWDEKVQNVTATKDGATESTVITQSGQWNLSS